jgi:phage tail-like protein
MAETGGRVDPYPSFRFVLELNDVPVAGFSQCSGLEVEIQIEDYEEGGQNRYVHKLPGRRRQTDLVLKRGIAGTELFDWFVGQELGDVDPTTLSLIVQAFEPEEIALEFEVHDAFPVRWQGPELDAAQAAVAIETLSLAHQGLRLLKRG